MSTLPVIAVACGVLRNARGEILLAQRPAGKIAEGFWEFPGGKIEPGEAPAAALARELHEELGIVVLETRPLIRFRHQYSNRIVILDTWLVTDFEHEPQGREDQALAWVSVSEAARYDTLPTVAPILRTLELPLDYAFTRPDATEASIRDGLDRLPRGALLRLRLPSLSQDDYAAIATRVSEDVAARGLRLVLDRSPELSVRLGAYAHHATSSAWNRLSGRPVPPALRFFGSAHSREDLQRLVTLGADAAVLGHVSPTASHPHQPALGWSRFAIEAAEIGIPVYAIGGVGPADYEVAFRHGAQGVAGISAYF